MTAYDQYVNLVESFSKTHESEIKSVLTFHNQKSEKPSALDYIPDYHLRNKENDPQEKPIFKQFTNSFIDLFFTPYSDVIVAELNGHHPEVHGKTLNEINKIKDLWNNAYLSTNYIRNELSFKLTLDLISQTMFKGEDRLLESKIDMGFWTMRKFMPDVLMFDDSFPCSYCNAHAKAIYDFNQKKFILPDYVLEKNPNPCPIMNKNKKEMSVYEFSLKTPSKKLLFLNDIRQVFKAKREDDLTVSINSDLGKKRECEAYVEHNIAKFQVGNTCPTIYQHKTKNEIIIDPENVKLKWDENTDTIKKADEYHDKGYICTDLWAVCMADYDDFMKRCKEKDIDPNDFDYIVVDIGAEKVKVKYNFINYLIQIKY